MKKLILYTILICFASNVKAQDTATVKRTALLVADAFLKGNYDTLLTYTYPKALAIGGGKAEMMQAISKVTEDLKNAGMSFRSVSLGPVGKFYKAGEEIHCVIPQTMLMNVKGGYVSSISPLMGISSDNGKSWTFIHAGNMTEQKIKMLFPNFNKELVLEKSTMPVFHPE